MKLFTLFVLFFCYTSSYGAQLFGVNLADATRDELRSAINNAGVKLVQAAGSDAFYDIYLGDSLLHRANHLYLGFVKRDKRFAFAEYDFDGLKQSVLYKKLMEKYGKPVKIKGKFFTDESYNWISEGVKISLVKDWSSYKTRLIYFKPEALNELKKEMQQFQVQLNRGNAVFLDQAY